MAEKKQKKVKKTLFPYTDRELSWLSFNERVLEEAYEKENPVLERAKFLSITASNLDEFFMVRVAGLKEQVRSGYKKPSLADQTPAQQLKAIEIRAHEFCTKQYNCLTHSIIPMLRRNGILILKYDDLNEEQKEYLDKYYESTLFPVLTPLAIDQSRPFPLLSNKSLNLCVRLKKDGESHFAVVQVPSILPRFLQLPDSENDSFIMLEDVITAKLQTLFEMHQVKSVAQFRITRNSDLTIDEEADDLLIEIQNSIKKRKRGRPVRLEINYGCDEAVKEFLTDMLDVKEGEIYRCHGPLDLTAWMKLSGISGYDHLRVQPFTPAIPADFLGCEDIFEAIRERDRFVHHPYESFNCVIDFIKRAADDPNVLAIKQTLYRVSGDSPVIKALMRAAENGKQVTVLVELKARFDEENNINWAKKLEHSGCHVIYGLSGLKTHCKILLIVRKDPDGIRRYLHLGTGNYNDNTAKLYTDMGLFTCREEFGADASLLFNLLTGYSRPPQYSAFVTAPDNMRDFFYRCIDREIENAENGKPSGITIKINSLLDGEIIRKLYDASCAGVKIDLLVRGICSLVPGVKDVSENITVHSIVGRFLEHSRIFRFENGGEREIYLGSADLMPRNLDRRVELVFPVYDEGIQARLNKILEVMFADTVNTRIQQSDASYELVDRRGRGSINSQNLFLEYAKKRELDYEEE